MLTPRQGTSRANLGLPLLTFLGTILLTLSITKWPSLYRFADVNQAHKALFSTPLRLNDDVMISLRAGYMIREVGRPAFNRNDLAQPSTSYVTPYLYRWLLYGADRERAIYLYALVGLLCAALTMACVVACSVSRTAGLVLAIALCLTKTHRLYALDGWDHLYQGFFLTVAAYLSLTRHLTIQKAVAIGLLLALGTLSRPDGFLIALGMLVSLWFADQRGKAGFFASLITYSVAMTLALSMNYRQFGHLLPTTVRLKAGAAPSTGYIWHYILTNSITSYSALTLFFILLFLLFVTGIVRHNRLRAGPIVFSCCATVCIALYNSDYFAGARMVWSSACVLAVVFAVMEPQTLIARSKQMQQNFCQYCMQLSPPAQKSLIAATLVCAMGVMAVAVRYRTHQAIISAQQVKTSELAQQYVIARWMNMNLHPSDGPVGFFYLGVSYDLPSFEIADFLGKADESIAALPIRRGNPPGHNKWDLDLTLAKWEPQAIVPPGPIDPNLPETRQNSHSHAPDLLLNKTIMNTFEYCYVPACDPGIADRWGFFLRKDLVAQHTSRLLCTPTHYEP